MTLPTPEQAFEFATMLQAGLAPADAIGYFIDSTDAVEVQKALHGWQRSREVRSALQQLLGKPWQKLTDQERIEKSLKTHYNQLATLLQFTNYSDLTQQEKAKADSARQALEAKLAGTAGRTDALTQFAADVRSGLVRLGSPLTQMPALPRVS